MHPLFTLVAGLAVGIMGVRLANSANTRKALQPTIARGGEMVRTGMNQARSGVLNAATSGLETVEKTSVALRRKLNDLPPAEVPSVHAHEGSVHAHEGSATATEANNGEKAS